MTNETLQPYCNYVKHEITVPLNYLKGKVSAVPRRGEMEAAELLRANLRARIPQKMQGEVARKAGIPSPDQTLSNFLGKNQKQLNYRYLAPLAKELNCSIADLFSPVGESSTLNPPDTREGSNGPNAIEARILLDRNAELEEENAALRTTLDALADQYKTLAGVVRPRKTAGQKPTPRGGH